MKFLPGPTLSIDPAVRLYTCEVCGATVIYDDRDDSKTFDLHMRWHHRVDAENQEDR